MVFFCWKKIFGFWFEFKVLGLFGVIVWFLNCCNVFLLSKFFNLLYLSILIFCNLWFVWKLLKKFKNGKFFFSEVRWVIVDKFIIFWMEFFVSIVNFVWCVVIMLLWLLKIFSDVVEIVFVEIWKIVGNSLLVILYILGIIKSKFWFVVYVLVSVLVWSDLWIVFVVFVFDCIFIIFIGLLNKFFLFFDDYLFISLVMVEEGVIG